MWGTLVTTRHGNETRTHGYPPKLVPILTRNTRVNRVQIWVRGLPDFFNRGRGRGQECHYPSHTHSRTLPDDEIIKILLITC